ncbi:MAG TPA: cytochrome P450 [Thiotrichales bacterium]|nr:cytochrome P450 [Thiotrichales bacterium]
MPDTSKSTIPAPLPPGPAEPIALDIDLQSQQAIHRLIGEYGDIFRVRIPGRDNDTYVVTNPDGIKQILVSNHTNYIKGRGFERVKMLLGNGIIVSDGDFWRRQRTMIQPAFSRKNIHQMCAMMETVTQQLIPRWQQKADSGEAIDITTEMSEFALEVILRALFAEDYDTLLKQRGENPFAFLTDDPSRNLAVAMKFRQLAPLIQSLITRRRDNNERHHDLLDALMRATDKAGKHMTDKELIDEVMTMIIAGHETSAGTLNWVWYELSRHPQAEQAVYDEAAAYVRDDRIDIDDVVKLNYTKQVINEALRLYPPVWLFTRKALQDDTVAGFHVPAGTDIFLSPFFTQRDPQLWEEPEAFKPERFRDDGRALKHKYAFLPFSAGSRRCIGEYFSYIEMQTHLAILMTRFKLQAVPDQQVELEPGINLRTRHSIFMTLARR